MDNKINNLKKRYEIIKRLRHEKLCNFINDIFEKNFDFFMRNNHFLKFGIPINDIFSIVSLQKNIYDHIVYYINDPFGNTLVVGNLFEFSEIDLFSLIDELFWFLENYQNNDKNKK